VASIVNIGQKNASILGNGHKAQLWCKHGYPTLKTCGKLYGSGLKLVNVSCEGDGLTPNHRNCNWIAKKEHFDWITSVLSI